MTRGQQLVLVVMVLLLLGVTVLLAYTLIATDDVASTVPTLAVFPAAVEQPDEDVVPAPVPELHGGLVRRV